MSLLPVITLDQVVLSLESSIITDPQPASITIKSAPLNPNQRSFFISIKRKIKIPTNNIYVFRKSNNYFFLFPDLTNDLASRILSSLMSERIGTLAYDPDGRAKLIRRSLSWYLTQTFDGVTQRARLHLTYFGKQFLLPIQVFWW